MGGAGGAGPEGQVDWCGWGGDEVVVVGVGGWGWGGGDAVLGGAAGDVFAVGWVGHGWFGDWFGCVCGGVCGCVGG